MTKELQDVLREIVAEQEKQAVAVIELQAMCAGQDVRLTRELNARKVTELFDTLRRKIDALP